MCQIAVSKVFPNTLHGSIRSNTAKQRGSLVDQGNEIRLRELCFDRIKNSKKSRQSYTTQVSRLQFRVMQVKPPQPAQYGQSQPGQISFRRLPPRARINWRSRGIMPFLGQEKVVQPQMSSP